MDYGNTGVDYSAKPLSLALKHLLATIPGDELHLIQNQDDAGHVYVVFGGPAGTDNASIEVLDPAAVAGGQGGACNRRVSLKRARILIYGDNTTTAVRVRAW